MNDPLEEPSVVALRQGVTRRTSRAGTSVGEDTIDAIIHQIELLDRADEPQSVQTRISRLLHMLLSLRTSRTLDEAAIERVLAHPAERIDHAMLSALPSDAVTIAVVRRLLLRHDIDPASPAWTRFVDRYGPLLVAA